MEISNDFLKSLAQIGFAACFQGMPKQAIAILEGISSVRPDNEKVTTALAIAYMNAHRIDDAIKLFTKALETDPGNATAKSFLGLTLKLNNEHEKGDKLLQEVAESSDSSNENQQFAQAVMSSDVGSLSTA